MKRILFISNIPTPYQIDFFNRVSQKVKLKCLFLSQKEENRDWGLDLSDWAEVADPSCDWNYIKQLIKEFNPSTVVVGGYSLRYSLRTLVYCRINSIFFAYWLEPPLPSSFFKRILKHLWFRISVSNADKIIGIGSNSVKIYSQYNLNVINIPYSIEHERYLRKKIVSRNIKFLYLGQYIERKGIFPLLDAIETLPEGRYTLDFAGSGELKNKISEFCEKRKGVRLQEFIEPRDLPSFISGYDVLIAPSLHDGWAVVIAEALISGLPVISSPYAGAAVDLIKSEGKMKNGVVVEPNSREIAAEMLKYIEHYYDISVESDNAYLSCFSSLAITSKASNAFVSELK